MPLLICCKRRRPYHPLDRMPGGCQCLSGCNGEGRNFFPCWESNTASLIIQHGRCTNIFLNKGCFDTGKFLKLAPLSSDVWLNDKEML